MNAVTIEIPEAYARSFGETPEEAARNAKLELAIGMYREGRWSAGKAAEFCGMYVGAFMKLLSERNIGRPYTREMLDQDLAYARGRF